MLNINLIGSDPEAIIYDNNDNPISSIGLIPGTKDKPYEIGNNCSIQTDNVMTEWCLPPSNNPLDLYNSFNYCIDWTINHLPQGYKIKCNPSEIFPKDQLQNPKALLFGCEPDYNAWTLCVNDKPISKNKQLRSCGGHIHISYNDPNIHTSTMFVKLLDLFLAVPFILIDPDNRRRELYGKAGAFRIKPYGFEYRVLSNYWLKSFDLIEYVFDQINEANKQSNIITINNNANKIQECINSNSRVMAIKLMKEYNIKPYKTKINKECVE